MTDHLGEIAICAGEKEARASIFPNAVTAEFPVEMGFYFSKCRHWGVSTGDGFPFFRATESKIIFIVKINSFI